MKNKSTILIYNLFFSICIILFSFSKALAQENEIYELKSNDSFSKSSEESKEHNNRELFNKLDYNLYSTIYIENGVEKKTYGELPCIKLTLEDVNSLNIINIGNNKYNEVQMLTIKINSSSDLNNSFDFSNISALRKLKFIYIKCNVQCTSDQIKNKFKTNSNTRIFYSTKKPS